MKFHPFLPTHRLPLLTDMLREKRSKYMWKIRFHLISKEWNTIDHKKKHFYKNPFLSILAPFALQCREEKNNFSFVGGFKEVRIRMQRKHTLATYNLSNSLSIFPRLKRNPLGILRHY